MTQVFPAKYEIVDNTGAVLVPEFSAYFDGFVLLEYPTGTPIIIPAGGILRDSCCAKADLCSILSIEIDETTNENVFLVGTCEWGRTPIGGAKADPVLEVLKTEVSTPPAAGYAEGDAIEYEVVISNVGTAAAVNVVLTETISPLNDTFDPQNLLTGGSVNISDGASYTLRYEYIVTVDDQVAGVLNNTAQVIGDNTLSPSQNSAQVTTFAPWAVQETFDPGTFNGTTSFEGSLGIWVLSGTVQLAADGNGFVQFGGDAAAVSPVVALPSGITDLNVAWDVRELGTLEPSDYRRLEYRLDAGGWVQLFNKFGAGTVVGDANISTGGASSLQFNAVVGNNTSGGDGTGGVEAMRLYDITVTQV